MNAIRNALDLVEFHFFRGPFTQLYTIMMILEGTSELTSDNDELDDDAIALDEIMNHL
jgi:hypothetical protein